MNPEFLRRKHKKICQSCGHPQSYPIPHTHDQTEREKQIIAYFRDKELKHVICTNCPAELVCNNNPQNGDYCDFVNNLAEDITVFFLKKC